MEKLDEILKVLPQNSAKGISVDEIAEKKRIHRTTAYRYLNSLELVGKVENSHGKWYSKTGEQTIKPLEKEIVIELPLQKNQWRQIGILDLQAKESEKVGFKDLAEDIRVLLAREKETRTIRITGKNVDDLALESLKNSIQQAVEQNSRFNLRSLFKGFKRPRDNKPQKE